MFWINADDYGFNEASTLGIINAFQLGLIHSTTACSNGYYFDEAVKLAFENGITDRIGLHLNVTEGVPLTDAIRMDPFFCNDNGEFHGRINRYKPLGKKHRVNLETELRAQFDRFINSGIPIHHVDSHHHIHTGIALTGTFISVANEYGVTAIRKSRNVNINNPAKKAAKVLFNLYLAIHGKTFSNRMGAIDDYLSKKNTSKWYEIDEVMVHPSRTSDGHLVDNHSETYSPSGPSLKESIQSLLSNKDNTLNVVFLSNAPAPYRVKFWNELGKLFHTTVLFELYHSEEREKEWVGDSKGSYSEVILPAVHKRLNDALCLTVIKYWHKNNINIIGGYNTPTGILSIIYMRLFRIPFIISIDGGMVKDDRFIVYAIKKWLLSGANYWLSTSKLADEYLIHYGAYKNRIFRYPFSSINNDYILDEPIDHDEKVRLRQTLGINFDRVIISVGRFIKSKAYDVLLEACNLMPRSIGVLIVGGLPTDEYLHLQDKYELYNVQFINHIDQRMLKKYYQASDCFVFPTLTDAWGLVVNEAMANALPVVATDHCVAAVEMIEDGGNGYVIPIKDPVSLADRTMRILEDQSLSASMSKKALCTVKNFTIEKMVEAHVKCIMQLCNGIKNGI